MLTANERLALIRVKIERAKRHLVDLEILTHRFIQSEPYTIARKPHPEPGYENFNLFFMSRIDPVPTEVSAVAGDAFHNLRSALDHLACHLVLVEGNPISDKTCFPVFKGTEIHESSFARQVEGMSDAAKDKIRSAEPYKDGKGHNLWVLHKLDIADKHHALVAALCRVGDIKVCFDTGYWHYDFAKRRPQFAAPSFGEPLEVGQPFFLCDRGTENKTEITFDITLNHPDLFEPKPIVWAVKYLIDKVDGLIGEFKPLLV